jgi:hypothetical protein
LLAVLGVALLCCIGGAVVTTRAAKDVVDTARSNAPSGTAPTTQGGAAPTTQGAAPPAEPTKAPPKADPGIGAAVRDGKFEFVVQKVECGQAKVGGEFLNKTAQGHFCLVTLSVKNIGDKPQLFADSNQKAFNATGAQYSTDSAATMYANQDGQSAWLNEINPGNSITGVIIYDIPKDSKIVRLELHDSAFSRGVKVAVG